MNFNSGATFSCSSLSSVQLVYLSACVMLCSALVTSVALWLCFSSEKRQTAEAANLSELEGFSPQAF